MDKKESTKRQPPVVAILGHIDHGKSTLLDYIRKSNIVDSEAGGITQHISAYEINHEDKDHGNQKITFIDTPGHEAFCSVRSRGAKIADIAILIVSAEDGVMPQTKEAIKCISEDTIPYIVAITKTDSPKADTEKAKSSLMENEIYLEGFGGDVPFVPVSAKTGDNVDELLSMILLVAELEELKTDPNKEAEGIIVESHKDMKKGVSATIIVKDGTLKVGDFVATDKSMSPVRSIETTSGEKLKEVNASTPIIIYGWSSLPIVGSEIKTFDKKKKKEAEKYSSGKLTNPNNSNNQNNSQNKEETNVVPLIIKSDVSGTAEAIAYELEKLNDDLVKFNIVQQGTGSISEADMKMAMANENTVVIGMGVNMDPRAEALKDREDITVKTFEIIYDLIEWIKELKTERKPKITTEEISGTAKILAVFNQSKKLQVIGGKVKEGEISVGNKVKILRRNEEIGRGTIKGLQQQKIKADKIIEGNEFGAALSCDVELAQSDHFEAIKLVTS